MALTGHATKDTASTPGNAGQQPMQLTGPAYRMLLSYMPLINRDQSSPFT